MKHKVSELSGGLLDAAVALANGRQFNINPIGDGRFCYILSAYDDGSQINSGRTEWLYFAPSSQWREGGPIIERERIMLGCRDVAPMVGKSFSDWGARIFDSETPKQYGPTPLIAAMRALVVSKLGEEVEIP